MNKMGEKKNKNKTQAIDRQQDRQIDKWNTIAIANDPPLTDLRKRKLLFWLPDRPALSNKIKSKSIMWLYHVHD